MNNTWRLAQTEADHRAVARLLNARRKEGWAEDTKSFKDRSDTEEWLLGTPPVGVAVLHHAHDDKWVIERIWIARSHRGNRATEALRLWEKHYKNLGIRQPHESMRPMLRRRGWGPELHDAMAEAGLAEPGETEPFEHDGVWVRHGKARS
jgi:hypothetical protein